MLKCSESNIEEYQANLRAAQDLIAEIIRRARPRKDELIYGVIGVPAQVSINNKQAILDAARETVDSVMLCSEPFSVAYGLDMLDDVLVIDIGAGTTDLCRMHGTMPEDADQITITHAGDWIDNRFGELLKESYPEAQWTVQMLKRIKERYACVSDDQPKIMVEFRWPVSRPRSTSRTSSAPPARASFLRSWKASASWSLRSTPSSRIA